MNLFKSEMRQTRFSSRIARLFKNLFHITIFLNIILKNCVVLPCSLHEDQVAEQGMICWIALSHLISVLIP